MTETSCPCPTQPQDMTWAFHLGIVVFPNSPVPLWLGLGFELPQPFACCALSSLFSWATPPGEGKFAQVMVSSDLLSAVVGRVRHNNGINWPYEVAACSSHGCYVEGYKLGNIFTLNIKMRLGASVWITTRVLQHITTLEERSIHWDWGTWARDRENLQAFHPYPPSGGQKASLRLGMLHRDCLYSWICGWEAEVVRPFIDWKSWKWSISALFLGGDSRSRFCGSHNRMKYTAQRNK